MEVFSDVTHVGVTTNNPNNVQFNPINTTNPPQISHLVLFEPFAAWNYADQEFKPGGITEWELNDASFDMTVRDGLTWTNGEDVTGEDVARQLRIHIANGEPLSEWAGEITVDGNDVSIEIANDVNQNLIQTDVLSGVGRQIRFDSETYGEYVSDGEVDIEGLREFEDSDPVHNGIFNLDSRGEQRLLATRNSDHPLSSEINFGQYAFDVFGGNNARQQALLSLEVDSDFSIAVPARLVANFPDAVEELRFPDIFGIGFTPNHDDPYAGDRAVRQAMAYAINRELCVQNSLPRAKQAPPIPTGVPSAAQEEFGITTDNGYDAYGVGSKDFESASAVMEEAGYSQQDGTWVDEEGNAVPITVTVPGSWSDWVLAAETAIQHLNEFGFNAELQTTGSYFDVIQSPGDFQFITHSWLANSPTTYPYRSLRHQLWEPQIHTVKYNYPPAQEASNIGGSEETLEVPSMDGGTMEVNTGELVSSLATTTDEDEQNSLIQELAWIANQDLPQIPIAEKRLQSWLTNDEWSVPENLQETAEANIANSPAWLPRYGMMNYTGN
jgi:peptide/nickel transport system substrate-binding protein